MACRALHVVGYPHVSRMGTKILRRRLPDWEVVQCQRIEDALLWEKYTAKRAQPHAGTGIRGLRNFVRFRSRSLRPGFETSPSVAHMSHLMLGCMKQWRQCALDGPLIACLVPLCLCLCALSRKPPKAFNTPPTPPWTTKSTRSGCSMVHCQKV